MKNIFFLLAIFFISNTWASSDIKNFINKTYKIKKKIDVLQTKYAKINENYINIIKKIEKIKEQISKTKGINKNIKNIFLNYYLFRGNKIAYQISKLKYEIKELKDDYFTYIVLTIDEYNKKIQECINKRCSIKLFEEIYFEREKWVEQIKNYEEILNIEDIMPLLNIVKDKDIKNDMRNYYEKKLIQLNQIILILNEEKEMRKKAAEYGIKKEYEKIFEIQDKIKSLIIKKAYIEKQIKFDTLK